MPSVGAAVCRRAAVLTTSPDAMPSPASGRAPRAIERLAGRDPDAHLELALLGERLSDGERSANGSLGIVLVCDRRAEDRHDRVADELLDRPAEALELGAHARVVGLEQAPHVLGIHALGPRREADEVAEEARDDLALLARARFGDRATRRTRAETRVLRVLAAAARADSFTGGG